MESVMATEVKADGIVLNAGEKKMVRTALEMLQKSRERAAREPRSSEAMQKICWTEAEQVAALLARFN